MLIKQVINNILTSKQSLYEAIQYDIGIMCEMSDLFKHIKDIAESGSAVDYGVLSSHLKKLNKYDKYGDLFFVDLMQQAPIYNIKTALKNLNEAYVRRRIAENSIDLLTALKNGKMEYETFIQNIFELQNEMTGSRLNAVAISDMAKANLDDIFKESNYLTFSIPIMREELIGFFNSNVITIAGSPGAGKTTFALQEAFYQDSLFISAEMPSVELYSKTLARLTEIPTIKIETKNLSGYEIKKILEANKKIEKSNMHIVTNVKTPYQIFNTIKYYVETKGVKIAYFDYLQLVRVDGVDTNTKLENFMGDIKSLAKELDIPIVVLSQLTKDGYKSYGEPTLADLRGSGAIAQDSDVVFILWFDSEGKFKLTVAKGRKYKKGTIEYLKLNGAYSRIEECFT